MAFAIVQLRNIVEIVPEKWLVLDSNGNLVVMWLPKNLTILQRDPNSVQVLSGEDKWKAGQEMVKRRGTPTYIDAENECRVMEAESSGAELSDSADNRPITRKMPVNAAPTHHAKIPSFNLPNKLLSTPPSTVTMAARKLISQQSPSAVNNGSQPLFTIQESLAAVDNGSQALSQSLFGTHNHWPP